VWSHLWSITPFSANLTSTVKSVPGSRPSVSVLIGMPGDRLPLSTLLHQPHHILINLIS